MTDDRKLDCAAHCRRLSSETYELAEQAECPEIIGDCLAIAAKLVDCAERVEAGEPSPLAQ